jgi:hypothetical protein
LIKSRTAEQCQKHHQHLQRVFDNDISKILEYLREKIKRVDPEKFLPVPEKQI